MKESALEKEMFYLFYMRFGLISDLKRPLHISSQGYF